MSRFYIPIVKGKKQLPDFSLIKDIGDKALEYLFSNIDTYTSVSFPELTTISGSYALYSTFSDSNTSYISFPKLQTITGIYAMRYSFLRNKNITSVSFPELTTISGYGCLADTFSNCSNITSVSFPKLTTVTGDQCVDNMFGYCSNITSVSFPKLTTISDGGDLSDMFFDSGIKSLSFPVLVKVDTQFGLARICRYCKSLTSISFPKLTTLAASALSSAFDGCTSLSTVSFPKLNSMQYESLYATFYNCTSLTSLSFPALTSNSFSGTSAFNSMLNGVTGCTVHFPSNLQSVIGSWSSVTAGFGGTNTTVLFNLPATS